MNEQEWRCSHCGKLLGIIRDERIHLKFARGHEYIVGFPGISVCRSCRTLNEVVDPSATHIISTQQAKAC